MADDESNEVESEELILKQESYEVLQNTVKNYPELEFRLQETASACRKHLIEFWEDIQWNHYLYGANEIDYFQLPVVNAFLSEWRDETSFEEEVIFDKCHTCLKIIESLNFAIAVCLHATEKQLCFWKQCIENLIETILLKLNYLSYMLLKNGEKYISHKSENMEYGTKDNECLITLCLWGNLYTAVRKQGMSMLGFSFKLPMDIVKKNCAVRVMHTLFSDLYSQKLTSEVKIKEEGYVNACVANNKEASKDAVQETYDVIEDSKEREDFVVMQDDLNIENVHEDATEIKKNSSAEKNNDVYESERGKLRPEKETPVKTKRLNGIDFTAFDPSLLPPLLEPDIQIVDLDEYFIVGGTFYFDLYKIPQLNVRKGNITYMHRENPELRRIHYKSKIVPPRTFYADTPQIVTVYEKNRFRQELENAIFIQLQLPKKVMYLSAPKPARLFPEKGGYSIDCVFDTVYEKQSRKISFKTNQFGVFGMLQKRYQNLPYKKWMLKASGNVILSLIGSDMEIDIQITNHGYSVTRLLPDDDFILPEINSTWMTFDLLNEKLSAVGINIILGENAGEFTDISKKEKTIEDNVYNCIALLCCCVNFMSLPKQTSSEEIALEFIIKKGKNRRVVIKNSEVTDYKKKERKVETDMAEKDFEKKDSNIESLESEEIEEQAVKKDITETAGKIEDVILETQNEPLFNNLYNYVLHEMDEKEREDVRKTDACLIENVRILLTLCRPISSM